jgi:hypothetical protein
MSLTILICAAGTQTRWEKSGGQGLKQLVEIDGEPIIRRLYRLLDERGHADNVVTLVRDPSLDCWVGLNPQKPAREDWHGEMGKFLDGRPYWPEQGEVCVLYGDAYYTGACLDAILDHEPNQPTIYGRARAKHRQSESFGIRFRVPDHVEEVERVARLVSERGLNNKAGPWRWFYLRHRPDAQRYRKSVERPALTLLATEENGWVEVGHDNTDDFDQLTDYTAWLANNSQAVAA